jgi:hypothetical protein
LMSASVSLMISRTVKPEGPAQACATVHLVKIVL